MTITATGDGKLLIKFHYDPAIHEALRNVPACHWEPKYHGWITIDTPIIRKMLLSELEKSGAFKNQELPTIKTDHPQHTDPQKQRPAQPAAVHPTPQAPVSASRSGPPPVSPLRKKTLEMLETKHYSPRTRDTYLMWLERFFQYHKGRNPRTLAEADINAFLTALAVDIEVSASTQNQALAAIIFFYRFVLERPLDELGEVIRAKKPLHLPVVMSRDEVRSVITLLKDDKRLAARLMYGTGLRLMECLSLRVQDIDFSRNEILVRNGKGAKDRVTMLPESLKAPLQEHLTRRNMSI